MKVFLNDSNNKYYFGDLKVNITTLLNLNKLFSLMQEGVSCFDFSNEEVKDLIIDLEENGIRLSILDTLYNSNLNFIKE